MKAPEIIFLPIVNIGVEYGECPAPIWWNKNKTAKHSEVVKAIEYIRKDFLLEWVNKELETARIMDFDEFGRGEVRALERIVSKLNSM